MSPQEMGNAVQKVRDAGNDRVLLTERGTFFGYNRLVNDFTGLAVMRQFGCPVVFDVTHSTQQPAGQGNQSGGNPQYAPLLARAAVAVLDRFYQADVRAGNGAVRRVRADRRPPHRHADAGDGVRPDQRPLRQLPPRLLPRPLVAVAAGPGAGGGGAGAGAGGPAGG